MASINKNQSVSLQTAEEILAPKTIPENELQRCRDMGAALAAGLAMGLF